MTDWQWYYSDIKRRDRAGPVSTEKLRAMIACGEIPRRALVWRPGMAGWVQAKSVFSTDLVPAKMPEGHLPLPFGLRGWMVFVGLALVVGGALFSVFLVGIPVLMAGLGVLWAASSLNSAYGVDAAVFPFLERLRFAFASLGCLLWAGLVTVILLAVVFAGASAFWTEQWAAFSGTLP